MISFDEANKKRKVKRDEVYHKQGIRFFEKNIQIKIKNTFNFLSKHHLHILETGELETILEKYNVNYKDKSKWIVDAVNKIAELSGEEIKANSDIYQFIEKIVINEDSI